MPLLEALGVGERGGEPRGALHRAAGAIGSAARLAAAVADAGSVEEGHELLTARGVRTELAYELDAAASGS